MTDHESEKKLTTCIAPNTVLDLLAGSLGEVEATSLREHLDDCDDCRMVMASVVLAQRTESAGEVEEESDFLPHPGMKIDRYEVVRLVGIGGMGLVYCANDPKLDRLVALKLLRPKIESHAALRERLVQESKIMAGLSSSHVATIYDVGEWRGRIFVALEFAEGGTLQEWMQGEARSVDETLHHFISAGKGLAAAHGLGIVHGDFKPANVLLTESAEVRVSDFGLARYSGDSVSEFATADTHPQFELEPGSESESDLEDTKHFSGTPAYMAPEQYVGGSASIESDQFSFCLSLYEALSGVRPARGASGKLVDNKGSSKEKEWKARYIAGLSRPASKALLRGLSADPQDRFSSMSHLLQAMGGKARSRMWIYVVLVATLCGAAGVLMHYSSRESAKAYSPIYDGLYKASENFYRADEFGIAEHGLDLALQVAEDDENIDQQVKTLIFQSQLSLSTGRGDDKEILRRAAKLAQRSDNHDLRAQAMARLASGSEGSGADVILDLAAGAAEGSPSASESRSYLELIDTSKVALGTDDDDDFVGAVDEVIEKLVTYQHGNALAQDAGVDSCALMLGSQEKAFCYMLRATQAVLTDDLEGSIALSNTALDHLKDVKGGDPCIEAGALFMRGGAYLEVDPAKSVDDFAKILRICPDEDRAINTMMWVTALAECERYKEAKRGLKLIDESELDEDEIFDLATLKRSIATRVRPTTLMEE